ncbi:MAG: acyl carrier protein [Anaerolineae bacterium]|nr:acyl carrier protein [Anaerolineae bacterium]
MSQIKAMSFKAFQAMLAELLSLDAALFTPDAYFITDLGVDSLRLAEILLYLEELGIEISADLAWEIQTVGDAYEYYKSEMRASSRDD